MEFDRPSESRVRLELTPLIDVIFQLLIFFMLSSTFIYPALDLKLPELTREMPPTNTQRLIVSVDQQGKYFINRESIGDNDLQQELARRLADTSDQSVYLRVDSQVAYGKFMELMDAARKAGAVNYHLLYEPTE